MKPSQILFAILILAGACSLSPASDAQSGGTGGLTVTVTDPSGGVIVGANVTISNGAAVTRRIFNVCMKAPPAMQEQPKANVILCARMFKETL